MKVGRPQYPTSASSAALAALSDAREARTRPEYAEAAVLAALALAPSDLDVRLAAYRFYFYNHRLDEALPHAEYILAHAARRLNIASDWREVKPADAGFGDLDEAPGLYLQALLAWGYCQLRIGAIGEGRQALAKVAVLDPRDRFGARGLLAVTEDAQPTD